MSGGADPDDVQAVYDRTAEAFTRHRHGSTLEDGWLVRFVAALPSGGHVLDLGCGSGVPIAQRLLELGFHVTGADFSPRMLALASAAFPQATWVEADMRRLDLGRSFDGIVAWHSFFHLTVSAQREALPRVLDHLRPGCVLMMTLGIEEGEGHGHVDGEIVYHASLSDAEYRQILALAGLEVVDFVHNDPSSGGANVLFARRPG